MQGSLADNNGYTINFTAGAFTVSPKTLTVAAGALAATYGDTLAALTYTNSGLVAGDSLTGALTVTGVGNAGTVLDNANGVNVSGSPFTIAQGSLTVSDGNGGGNYNIVYTGNTLTLAAKTLTDTGFAVAGRTYDGLTDAAIIGNGSLTGGGAISSDGEYLTGDDVSIAGGGSASFGSRNAGSETATGNLSLAGNQAGDYILTAPTATAAITAEALTITAQANSKTYDGNASAAATPTITAGAVMTGDSAGFSETYGGKNAGTGLTLTPSGLVSDGNGGANYTYTFDTSANGIITAKALTVTAANQAIIAGSPDPALTYSFTGLAGGDNAGSVFSGALARARARTSALTPSPRARWL